jgi:DNA-binding sugar fermentation-stimulating protein
VNEKSNKIVLFVDSVKHLFGLHLSDWVQFRLDHLSREFSELSHEAQDTLQNRLDLILEETAIVRLYEELGGVNLASEDFYLYANAVGGRSLNILENARKRFEQKFTAFLIEKDTILVADWVLIEWEQTLDEKLNAT